MWYWDEHDHNFDDQDFGPILMTAFIDDMIESCSVVLRWSWSWFWFWWFWWSGFWSDLDNWWYDWQYCGIEMIMIMILMILIIRILIWSFSASIDDMIGSCREVFRWSWSWFWLWWSGFWSDLDNWWYDWQLQCGIEMMGKLDWRQNRRRSNGDWSTSNHFNTANILLHFTMDYISLHLSTFHHILDQHGPFPLQYCIAWF